MGPNVKEGENRKASSECEGDAGKGSDFTERWGFMEVWAEV